MKKNFLYSIFLLIAAFSLTANKVIAKEELITPLNIDKEQDFWRWNYLSYTNGLLCREEVEFPFITSLKTTNTCSTENWSNDHYSSTTKNPNEKITNLLTNKGEY